MTHGFILVEFAEFANLGVQDHPEIDTVSQTPKFRNTISEYFFFSQNYRMLKLSENPSLVLLIRKFTS
jgi:hypothetical protein